MAFCQYFILSFYFPFIQGRGNRSMVNAEGKHQDVNMCAWESLLGLVVGMGWMGWGYLLVMNQRTRARSRSCDIRYRWTQIETELAPVDS
jgi:hypothetical protein